MTGVDEKQISKEARALVERARLGDQNAMAMIAQVRESALKGSPRAKIAQAVILEQVKRHPVKGPKGEASVMGEDAQNAVSILREKGPVIGLVALFVLCDDGPDAVLAGSVTLANGPALDDERIKTIGAAIEDADVRKAFYYGVAKPQEVGRVIKSLTSDAQAYLLAGRCVGMARAIQLVRMPGSSLSAFSPQVGWEFGE